MYTNHLIARQTAAIRRANPAQNPTPDPGGARARSEAELALAAVLRSRYDAHHLYADAIVGAEMAARVLAVVADLECRGNGGRRHV